LKKQVISSSGWDLRGRPAGGYLRNKARQRSVTVLKESESFFRFLVVNSRDLIYYIRIRPTPVYEYVSPSAVYVTGYSPEEFYKDPRLVHKIIHPDDRHILEEVILSKVAPEHPLVLRWIRKDGGMIWVELQISQVRDEAGSLIAVGCTARDITEREQHKYELEAIVAIGASMRQAASRDELLGIILQRCLQMLNAQGVALAVRDPFSGKTIIEQGCGVLESASGLCFPPEANLAALASLTQSYQASSPGLGGTVYALLTPAPADQHVTCSPLVIQNELIGVMLVVHECEIHAAQIRLLTTVNEIAASALQRTTLSDQAAQYTRQMATAGELGLMLAKTLNLPTIYAYAGQFMRAMLPDIAGLFVSLFDPLKEMLTCVYGYGDGEEIDSTSLPPIPLELPGKGMQSRAVRSRHAIIVADIAEERKHLQVDIVVGEQDRVTRSGLFVPMLSKDKVIGVVSVQSYLVNRFTQQDVEVMTLVSNTIAVAIENARLVRGLRETYHDLVEAYDATMAGWTLALDYRDHETEGHSLRVTELTVQLARRMKIDEDQILHIQRGALLHDIGKIGIPDAILNKPGALTDEEWEIMRTHPQIAYDLLSPIEYLQPALDIPYCHHEKWDGSGYPRGMRGEQIPLAARLFAVVDVWDALCSDRSYRPKWPLEKTREYIRLQAGLHFDPGVVAPFLEMVDTEVSPH
jgi:PAS domain S-box-containing protein